MKTDATEISLRAAQNVIDILNDAMELDGEIPDKVAFLLRSLITLLDRPSFCTLVHLSELERSPAPIIIKRYVYGSSSEYGPLYPDEVLQSRLDEHDPIVRTIIPHVLASPRVPWVVMVRRETRDRDWLEKEFVPRLHEHDYEDALIAAWSATPDRMIGMSIFQIRGTPPFSEEDRTLMSLMLRAVAPFIDREIFFADKPLVEYGLTERQREVLLHLLAGESEKETARHLCRSVHTVHTFVKQLHEKFKVSSRGELMAKFIDETVSRAAQRQVGKS